MLYRLLILLYIACHASTSAGQLLQEVFIDQGVSHQYIGGIWGGGVSMADFTGDGIDDVTLARNGDLPLFLVGTDTLLQSIQLPFPLSGEVKQVNWVDIDNDGDRDFSVSGFNMPFMIFERSGDWNLLALDTSHGLSDEVIVGYGHSWGDYDRDGDLDVFVCNYDAAYMGFMNADNRLYRNDGDLHFTDVTLDAGFVSMVNYTFMALWMDYNRDLFPDLLVLNDRTEVPNYCYHNNGDGTFTEIAAGANLDDYIWSMTATADDYDNDGDADIYITNGPEGNVHKRNNGDGTFTDVAEFQATVINHFCWSAQFTDINRDGWQDLHVCSTPIANLEGENFALMNVQVAFQDSTESAGIANDKGWSRSSAVGDFNHDGLADMVVSKSNPDYSSFWLGMPNPNHGLKVTLEGTVSNREGVSSWIDVYSDSLRQSRYTYCGEGYLAQNSFSEFFGFAQRTFIDSLVVSWPSGIIDRWYNIPADQQLHLVEGTSRRVEVSAPIGWGFCTGDSAMLMVNEWNQYAWSVGSDQQSATVNEPQPVVVEVTDLWGNHFLSDTVQIAEWPAPSQPVIDVEHVTCNGLADGRLVVDGVDNQLWFVFNSDTLQNGAFEGLSAGAYHCEIENQFGCKDSIFFDIQEPTPLITDANVVDCSCFDSADGAVDISISGGTPDYGFPGNTPVSGLSAGNYVYQVSDANGCISELSVIVDAPAQIVIACVSGPEEDATANGWIASSASGGTPPYAWLLNGMPSDSATWNGLVTGNYLISLTDAMGCSMQADCFVQEALGVGRVNTPAINTYPNPVEEGEPWMLQTSSQAGEVFIYDAMGQKVGQGRIDASGGCRFMALSAGMYVVRFMQENNQVGSLLLLVK